MQYLKNLIIGAGTVLQIFPVANTGYVRPQRGDTANDQAKISGDWQRVGNDLKVVIKREQQTYNC